MGKRDSGRALPVLLLLIALAGLAFVGLAAFRVGSEPEVALSSGLSAVGKRTPVTVRVHEGGRGLSRVKVEFVQGTRVETLSDRSYRPRAPWALWGSRVDHDEITVEVGRDTIKALKQGTVTIRATADRAGSWLRNPGPVVKELSLPVRLTPPAVQVLSTATYVAQGGAEAVVYRVGETATHDGVEAGGWFFPGAPLPGGGKDIRFALFSAPYDTGSAVGIKLVAADDVGNESRVAFIDKFFPHPPAHDTIDLTEAFMSKVVPEILSQTPDLADQGDLLQNYLRINRDLRKANNAVLVDLAKNSKPEFLWGRPFQQMGNTQVMARFADHRTYVYKGHPVDQQVHLGLDLAATRAAPIPASNDGIVVLARFFGIYGNSVVVDHGFGLMSLYGHLSSIEVKEGQAVRRGETIGRSGDTGLAGGDHLHFTLLLHGLPINPIEWWEAHWIQDRIARKLGAGFRFQPERPTRG